MFLYIVSQKIDYDILYFEYHDDEIIFWVFKD